MRISFFTVLSILTLATTLAAQDPPDYQECKLLSVFPNGAQQGQSVTVEFLGVGQGLDKALNVLVDGPPGIAVRHVKNTSASLATATFDIAADAPPGRRNVRVLNERSGLTNFAYFVVGRLPEALEKEKNNTPAEAQAVAMPVVVNGRVTPQLDVDCFRFTAQKDQRIVAAALSHAFDAHGDGAGATGFVDTSLEVLDARGRVLAEAQDTLGLDPAVDFTVPADGDYVVRVQMLGYKGFPQAVYRLSLGELPLATSVFPPGGRRGESVEVEFLGPNVASGTRQLLKVDEGEFPFDYISLGGVAAGDHDLRFVRGDLPESIEAEPNESAEQATPLTMPLTINGRFDRAADEDWYRVQLNAGQPMFFQIIAQRYLRSPVDTRLELFAAHESSPAGPPSSDRGRDATSRAAELLAQNDDAVEPGGASPHEFAAFDSEFTFTPKADGEFWLRVSEQTGAAGAECVYRLTVRPVEPDFRLYVWPDAVPIWGPGTTAAVLVKVERRGGLDSDIELAIDGLPAGWTGSVNYNLGSTRDRPNTSHNLHAFLIITAPADAKVGDHTTFRVIGRTVAEVATGGSHGRQTVGSRTHALASVATGDTLATSPLARTAQPLTFYHSGDRGFYRASPMARAVVARPQGAWLSTSVRQLKLAQNSEATIPVAVHDVGAGQDKITVVVNLPGNGVACGLGPPVTLPVKDGQIQVPVKIAALPPGKHGIVVSRAWRSDVRAGMPGPCTEIIEMEVTPGM